MSLITQIRTDALTARKAHDPMGKFLMTLVSDADTKSKDIGRPVNDTEVQEIVQKFIKNLDENIALLSDHDPERAYQFIQQRNVIATYLPQQMSPEDLEAFARERRDEGLNMGQIMSRLKAEHFGKYDGRAASQVVKDILAETDSPRP